MTTALRPIDQFKTELKLMEPNFTPLLPANVSVDKFKAMVIAAVGGNPDLLKCTRASLWKACVQGAELGLSLNPTMGEADILPQRVGSEMTAQFRPRYKGLMNLARRSGEVTSIRAVLVYENDEFEVIEGLRPDIIHKPSRSERGTLSHAYCVWLLKGVAEPQFEVMDKQQVMRVKARSPSGKNGNGPWKTDEEEMWRKTVVKRATKYMPIALDVLAKAVAVDNLNESGTDFDITEDGEVIAEAIDVTAEPDYDDTTQVEEMEEAVAAEDVDLPMLDFKPSDTWGTWLSRAAAIVKSLPKDKRKEWGALHNDLIDEADGSQPKGVIRLRFLIDGGE